MYKKNSPINYEMGWLEQCAKRKLKLVVVGIPKTIDNDIELLDKTFGFDTAVEEAQRAINAAYIEVSDKLGHLNQMMP